MKKRVFGRQFNRNTDQRKQLFRNLMRSFILHGKLRTTEAKISAVRSEVERMVTKAKNKGQAAENDLMRRLADEEAVQKLISIAPKFINRPGGYTRVLKMGERVKDAAPVSVMLWVETMDVITPMNNKRVKKEKVEAKEATMKVEKKTKAVKAEKKTKK